MSRAGWVAALDGQKDVVLDLCCGEGGMSAGLVAAGFDVIGVDITDKPRYPYPFLKRDAMQVLRYLVSTGGLWHGIAPVAIHISPPCPRYSNLSKSWNGNPDAHPDLVDEARELLEKIGLPYVIENVVGAPLRNPVKLCGSMFDRPVERHRLFETNFSVPQPACNHARQTELWPEGFPALRSGRSDKRARVVGVFGTGGGAAKDLATWEWAMGIDWMSKKGLSDSVPPCYGKYIGEHLQTAIRNGSPAMIDTNDFEGAAHE